MVEVLSQKGFIPILSEYFFISWFPSSSLGTMPWKLQLPGYHEKLELLKTGYQISADFELELGNQVTVQFSDDFSS